MIVFHMYRLCGYANQMLTALDKVLKSDWTLPANTSGALLHTAILATKINGQLFWVWHTSASIAHVAHATLSVLSPALIPGLIVTRKQTDTCVAGTTGPIQFEDNGDRKASSNREFRVYNHQGMHA